MNHKHNVASTLGCTNENQAPTKWGIRFMKYWNIDRAKNCPRPALLVIENDNIRRSTSLLQQILQRVQSYVGLGCASLVFLLKL